MGCRWMPKEVWPMPTRNKLAINKKYKQSEKGKIVEKRYRLSNKNKAVQKRYRQSEKGKETIRRKQRRYAKTIYGCLLKRFSAIKQRCNNPDSQWYHCYGGRGIKCKFRSTKEFVNYVVNELKYDNYNKIKKLQIDRIDNNGHYEPGNIQFVTAKENSNNRRTNL